MSVSLSIVIVCEVLSTLLIVWGFMHEEKLVAFEDKIKFSIHRKIRKIKRNLCAKWLSEEGLIVPKKPIEVDERKVASR